MVNTTVDLSKYDNSDYNPGAPVWVRGVWFLVNWLFFQSGWMVFYAPKRALLRLFGARIGKKVVIKPRVTIKYPWNLSIGDYSWIGEGAWIDNLDTVQIGAHCVLSQGAMLLCGNHNYQSERFDLVTRAITLEEGSWIGARSLVTAGVSVGSHAVLAVLSVASSELAPYTVYRGNPAKAVKTREVHPA